MHVNPILILKKTDIIYFKLLFILNSTTLYVVYKRETRYVQDTNTFTFINYKIMSYSMLYKK